jgi:hypothetical protein
LAAGTMFPDRKKTCGPALARRGHPALQFRLFG